MPNTPLRAVRIADDVWRPALTCAEHHGDTLTDVIRTALTDYIHTHNCGATPMNNRTIRLPRRFYDDHVLRDLPAGEVIKATTNTVTVILDPAAERDLLEDARFYVDMGTRELGRDMLGLVASARATIKRLEA